MPDRDPVGYLATLQGEEMMAADSKRHDAQRYREEAEALDRQATYHDERAAWLGRAIDALAEGYEKTAPRQNLRPETRAQVERLLAAL